MGALLDFSGHSTSPMFRSAEERIEGLLFVPGEILDQGTLSPSRAARYMGRLCISVRSTSNDWDEPFSGFVSQRQHEHDRICFNLQLEMAIKF